MEIALRRLGRLIATCWDRAEISARNLIAEKHPAPSGVHNRLMMGELRVEIENASNSRAIERLWRIFICPFRPSVLTILNNLVV